MSIWHIYGGNWLTGSTRVQGAKNAVLPIMAASVLSGGETVLHNVPDLRDVTTTLRILRHLGCTAVRDGDTVRIDSRGMHCDFIPHALMRELRSSVIFLGAILARFGTARLSMPGGCELGPRPVNLHLDALRALGAEVTEREGAVTVRNGMLRGITVDAGPIPDLIPTLRVVAAAAVGDTRIENARRLRDKESDRLEGTAALIRDLGGSVRVEGDTLLIHGQGGLRGGNVSVLGDHRLAMAAAIAACICRESVTVDDSRCGEKSYPRFWEDLRQLKGEQL